jgi:hypothetical protein
MLDTQGTYALHYRNHIHRKTQEHTIFHVYWNAERKPIVFFSSKYKNRPVCCVKFLPDFMHSDKRDTFCTCFLGICARL